MTGLGRVCKCGHRAASHDRRESWCSAYVDAGEEWASDRFVGRAVDPKTNAGSSLYECRCERFTRRHR